MIPSAYALPAAAVFAIGGALACFAGYRLLRIVLGVYGFIIGALITTNTVGASSTFALVLAGVVGGLVGAALMIAAYFVGVALIGAGLGATIVNVAWRPFHGAAPWWAVLVAAILGGVVALSVTRYIVIVGTALLGSWTLIIGGLAMIGDAAAGRAVGEGSVWVIYPLDAANGRMWLFALWVVLAAIGTIVQLSTTTRLAGRKSKRGA